MRPLKTILFELFITSHPKTRLAYFAKHDPIFIFIFMGTICFFAFIGTLAAKEYEIMAFVVFMFIKLVGSIIYYRILKHPIEVTLQDFF